ncbi:GTP-binding protein [Candidatus Woesearchaeota archaeon CG10_big_fil_rev_8_21_14_0_10_37_12]|nr:MAG: GTP-binding protein [Candidatus Woesearchaeota archaeon CG10_big_fil_rev_8_21_14_0_10_37_12]
MADEHAKIKELEDQMSKAKYNKATEKWFGLLKSQIAKLREKIEKKAAGKGASEGFAVRKTGNGTVILVGFPSVGKSTLLNSLTGAESKVAAYEFTTLDCIPGTLNYKHARIQVLDVPGIIAGAAYGRGRGKEVLALTRNADLILFVVDATHPEHYPALIKEVYDVGVRVNKQKPDVKITKKSKGGLNIHSTVDLPDIDMETMEAILRDFKVSNADVVIRDKIDIDGFIDAIDGNKKYLPALVCVTKMDLVDGFQLKKLRDSLPNSVFVSAQEGKGIAELKDRIYDSLNFARIFLKEINKKPDLDVPLILTKPVTLRKVCQQIHKDFVRKFRFAKVWGKSAKFDGQQFQTLDKELVDGDVVEVHLL